MEKINYYKTDDEMSWVASRVFMDEHYGTALTEEELQQRTEMEEDYKNEIEMAKLMLENNPKFCELSFEEKINVSANLIVELREKRTKNNGKSK